MITRTIAIFLLAALAGCSQMQTLLGTDETRESRESREVVEMLAWSQRTAQSPAEEQRRELALANQAYTRERSPQTRLRLALLLAYPGSAINDDARAAGLLEAFASPGGGPVQQLGNLLYVQVGERVKEQRRVQQMKEQLDALRALERSLIDRGQTRPR